MYLVKPFESFKPKTKKKLIFGCNKKSILCYLFRRSKIQEHNLILDFTGMLDEGLKRKNCVAKQEVQKLKLWSIMTSSRRGIRKKNLIREFQTQNSEGTKTK
jgi:hypothetical protein